MSQDANIQTPPVDPNLPPVKLAFILDNVVQDVLHTDDRLAAIFLSEPVVIDVTGPDGQPTAFVGYVYNPADGTFAPPPADPAPSA